MNAPASATSHTIRSVCPHDCPSVCALDVDILADGKVGRVRGAKDDPYTAGVICEKVARYAERIHHAERLVHPMRRIGPKGAGQWERITWDEALDEIARRFIAVEEEHGAESVWPYFYAGTGLLGGVNPEQMAEADCVVIWGTNAVHTQVNVMTHAMRARKTRGAKIVVIDIYRNATMQQADLGLVLRPGTDGALAVATMHVLLRDNLADRAYMARYTDFSPEFAAHLATRTPEWASEITGLSVAEIEAFAHLVGKTPRTFFRLGYGFSRQRNGTTAVHAAL